MTRKRRYEVVANDLDILNIFLEYANNKNYLRNILKKNDKSLPYYSIIIMSIDNKDLKKLIQKKFYNQIIVR